MRREDFRELTKRIVYLDGATGSNLMAEGMPSGVCPEEWILKNPQVILNLQREYIKAGTDILYAPTFSANTIKLSEYGISDRADYLNHELVALSKKAVSLENRPDVLVAGDMTMTGRQLLPVGTLDFEELVEVYKKQAQSLMQAGVDLITVETMMSLQESRAALIAIREATDLPVMVTLTFAEDGKTLFGTDAVTAGLVLSAMGADAVGVNCSTGPDRMEGIVRDMLSVLTVPMIVKPNAGLPEMHDGRTVYGMGEEEFAEDTAELVKMGATICGGCCGTTPKYIKRLKETVEERGITAKKPVNTINCRALSTEHRTVFINDGDNFKIIGERINPTGKTRLQEELRQGKLDLIEEFALKQEEDGAQFLDINVGMNGIDEKEMMLKVTEDVTAVCDLPLCIDSSHADIIEAALRRYPGRALINSVSLEEGKAEKLLPVAKKYGAMFILLPVSEEGLPKNLEEKKSVIDRLSEKASDYGLSKNDFVADGLVNTVGANRNAALEVLETIRYCKSMGIATMAGLSNISFGLPERQFVNMAFLAFAIHEGLAMAIANPGQELLVNTAFASDMLMNRPDSDVRYIERVKEHPLASVMGNLHKDAGQVHEAISKDSNGETSDDMHDDIYMAVMKGNRRKIAELTKKHMECGEKAEDILNNDLIAAINKVGELFNNKKYYLPQLISSAEAMKTAVDCLKPFLSKNEKGGSTGVVVIATVEGDIHDIGKNLVVLMLENHGFEVHDLGKDVPAEKIIEEAKRLNADIIGLSALMTTTMLEMKKVVGLRNENKLKAKIMVGGAVITQGYCDEIGADGYSKDAQQAVEVAVRLINKK